MNKKAITVAALLSLLAIAQVTYAAPTSPPATNPGIQSRSRDGEPPNLWRLLRKIGKRLGITTNEDLPIPPRP